MHQHLKLLRRRSGSFCKTVKSDLWKLRLSPATAPNTRLTLNLYQVLRSNKKALHRTISNPWAFKPASCLYGLPSTLAKQVSLSCEVYRHIKPDREHIPNISNHKHSFIDVVQIAVLQTAAAFWNTIQAIDIAEAGTRLLEKTENMLKCSA